MTIRTATPADVEAITAIYAPIVANTGISFELAPPTVDEMGARIVKTLHDLPWLVSEDAQGAVNGYVYASRHRERPAYQWSVDVTAYLREDARGQGVGKRLYPALFAELITLGYFQAFAGIALPNDASVALHARSASSSVLGTTWAGGKRNFVRQRNPRTQQPSGEARLPEPRAAPLAPHRRAVRCRTDTQGCNAHIAKNGWRSLNDSVCLDSAQGHDPRAGAQ